MLSESIKNITKKFSGTPKDKKLVWNREILLKALSKVQDPDLHQDIVTLGFVREIEEQPEGTLRVVINLTTPACPEKENLKQASLNALKELELPYSYEIILKADRPPFQLNKDGMQSLAQVKNIVAIASGKGGVAKSTSAVNIAFGLAQAGAKVAIFDADIYGPSLPLMVRPDRKAENSDGSLIELPSRGGVKFVSISMFQAGDKPAILRGPMASQIIKQFFSHVHWGELDYLIIDYPPGTGDIQLSIAQLVPLAGAVIVTTPQEASLIDVRKAISMFETTKVPVLGVIETMSYFVCDSCDKKHAIFGEGGGLRLASETGLPLLGRIPMMRELAESCDSGDPLVLKNPKSLASQAYLEISGQLAAQISILNAEQAGATSLGISFDFKWQ